MSLDDLDPDGLYHLALPEDWEAGQATGRLTPPSLDEEGFVHCSWGAQVAGTVAKHFPGVTGLLALRVDPDRLGESDLVEEDSYGGGQAFPHIYGPLVADAVVGVVPVS